VASVSVIIPSLAGGQRLREVLDSLARQTVEHETIVVDNGSGGAVSRVVAGRSGVEVVALAANAGFSRAVNIAAARAAGERLVLVNDDSVCDPGFVEAIAGALDPARGVIMAAGVMRDQRDRSLIDTAGVELDRTLLGFDYLNGEPVSVLDDGVEDPVGPSGAAAAFDRDAFLAVGGFDERLFAYWEDVDLALRLNAIGGRCALAAAALGTHAHSATLGAGSARKNYLMGFGRGYVLRKWSVLRSPRRAAAVLARDTVVCLGQAVVDRNLAGVRGRVRGYRATGRTEPFPDDALTRPAPGGALTTLRRRAERRARLRRGEREVTRPSEQVGAGGAPRRVLAIFHLADTSGPSRSLESELEWLSEERAVEVIVPGPGRVADAFGRFSEVTVVEYEALTLPRGARDAVRAARRLLPQVRAFRDRIRATRPELVIVVTAMLPAALVAARLERVPSVVYVGEMLVGGPGDGVRRRLTGRLLGAATSRLASTVIACSRIVARPFERSGSARVTTIYPPIQAEHAGGDGARLRGELGIGERDPCVVAVGNITRGRGQDLLLRAVPSIRREFPGVRCVVAGDPFPRSQDFAFRDELERLATDLGVADSVTLTGFRERAADLYAAADVFVNPVRFPESFGRAACEALVAGTPVVATRVGAIPEILVDGETASVVEPEDPEAIAAAVVGLLGDRDRAQRLADAGRRDVVERFGPERSLAGFRQVVESLTSGDRH
jgi:glycosyltransferase involved in cell wall biosynthesis/GT2 family glycosyltransferase